jgi:hypothetical protein
MTEFEPQDPRDDALEQGADRDALAAERLAQALAALEAGADPHVDPREDPELAALLRTAGLLRNGLPDPTESPAFRSYRARSRAYVLHSLEHAHAPATPQPEREPEPAAELPARWRWGSLLVGAPLAAAAAAVALILAAGLGGPSSSDQPASLAATNRTSLSADEELLRMRIALDEIAVRTSRGEPVDARLLRTVTENTAAVANRIKSAPQTVNKDAIASYHQAVTVGRAVLGTVQPAAGSEAALAAAQQAAQDGHVAAARFLGTDGAAGTPTSTATPAASATPAATPTPKPSATPTPAPTATPEATAVPLTPTPGATATVTPQPSSGPTIR